MDQKRKYLTGPSRIALTSMATGAAVFLAGCGGEQEGDGVEGESADQSSIAAQASQGEGRRAGGEGEGATMSGDPASDNVALLHRLGMVRGHLIAFRELYRADAFEMAATHAKHPEDEIYRELAPAFDARGLAGFRSELEALAQAAEQRSDIEGPYEAVIESIRHNDPVTDIRARLLAVSKVIQSAGDEFALGVGEDGAIVNIHEYQDAFGFVVAARELLAEVETGDINASEAIAVAHEQLDLADSAFAGLMSSETDGDASTLYGAAARIEIAAAGL